MNDFNWLEAASEKYQLEQLMGTNQLTKKFGLALTEDEGKLLIQERYHELKEQQRVEFGEGILPKIIYAFCDSPYIHQYNYVESICRLQEIFYLYKNEAMDELTDDELLEYMKEKYDTVCSGSFDYLEDTVLEEFARSIRAKTRKFIGRYQADGEV